MKKTPNTNSLPSSNQRRKILQRGTSLSAWGLSNSSLLSLGLSEAGLVASAQPAYPSATDTFDDVVEGRALSFPRDHGAHPDYRTEWWYLTGWLDTGKQPLGFQVTFFRSRTIQSRSNPSQFSASQLMFAHVALANPETRVLDHDQRSARTGFGHASFAAETTDVRIGDWRFWQTDPRHYQCVVRAKDFSLQLAITATQPVWLQGNHGYSRKGPRPLQASYYYSRPQLSLRAELQWRKRTAAVTAPVANRHTGIAWLDHEWSSQVLDPQASGWDWIGLNLHNGDALMAFQIRRANDHKAELQSDKSNNAPADPLWRHARLRLADQSVQDFSDSIRFRALRWWRSTRTGISYPVEMAIGFGERRLTLVPLFDDQELDSRQSTGNLYWEGAVNVLEGGQAIGRGYLELTGYGDRVRF